MESENTSPTPVPETPAYQVDIGALFTRAFEIFKPKIQFFILAALIVIAVIIVAGIINFIAVAISSFILFKTVGTSWIISKVLVLVFGAITIAAQTLGMAAMMAAFLPVLRGGEGKFDDLHLFLKDSTVLKQVLTVAGVLFVISLAGIVPILGGFVAWVVTMAFNVLAAFALPLILDKKMEAIPSIKLSCQKVLANPMSIVFLILAGIVAGIGIIAFGVGIVATIPFAVIAILCLYEVIFSGGMPAAPALPAAAPEAPAPPAPPAEPPPQPPTE